MSLKSRAFLVGPNASGKSNFLDLFRFLHDIVAVGGGFQEAIRKRGTVSKLRCLSARSKPNIVVKFGIGTDDSPDLWSYKLSFTQDNRQRPLISSERVRKEQEEILVRPDQHDIYDPERLSQTNVAVPQLKEPELWRDPVRGTPSTLFAP